MKKSEINTKYYVECNHVPISLIPDELGKFIESDNNKRYFKKDDYKEEFLLFKKDKEGKEIYSNFVGFVIINNNLYVSLPKFLKFKDYEYYCESEYEFFKYIKYLLYKYHAILPIKDKLFKACVDNNKCNLIVAAQQLGQLYLDKGFYQTRHVIYNTSKGRIAWNRTVSRKYATFSNKNITYQKFIKRTEILRQNIITEIQRSVLYYLFKEAPYGQVLPFDIDIDSSTIIFEDLKNEYYINIIKDEIYYVYDDDYLNMFNIILDILEERNNYGNNENDKSKDIKCEAYAIMNFEYVFELMLGDYFGNEFRYNGKNKSGGSQYGFDFTNKDNQKIPIPDINRDTSYSIINYDKKLEYNIVEENKDNNISIPDIIFKHDNCVYLIDAKYYGEYKDNRYYYKYKKRYPGRDDILKQVHYENILYKIIKENDCDYHIKNIFFMPYFLYDDNYMKTICKLGTLEYINKKETITIYVLGVNCYELSKYICFNNCEVNKNRYYLKELLENDKNNFPEVKKVRELEYVCFFSGISCTIDNNNNKTQIAINYKDGKQEKTKYVDLDGDTYYFFCEDTENINLKKITSVIYKYENKLQTHETENGYTFDAFIIFPTLNKDDSKPYKIKINKDIENKNNMITIDNKSWIEKKEDEIIKGPISIPWNEIYNIIIEALNSKQH